MRDREKREKVRGKGGKQIVEKGGRRGNVERESNERELCTVDTAHGTSYCNMRGG